MGGGSGHSKRYLVESLEPRRLLSADLVADLVPSTQSSFPGVGADLGGKFIFWVSNELWRSDGTSAGTELIHAGFGSPSTVPMTIVHGAAYFGVKSAPGAADYSLWRSDGTANGTTLVADVNAGGLWACDTTLYFSVLVAGQNKWQLWKVDGAQANATMVHEFASTSLLPSTVVYYNGFSYFTATRSDSGSELWRTDGTDLGTVLFDDIVSGTTSSAPQRLAVSKGLLYFAATNSTAGLEPWRSDGTIAGTFMLRDIKIGSGGSSPGPFLTAGDATVFLANGQLWRSNGTSAGTAQITPTTPGSLSYVEQLTQAGGKVFFSAFRSSEGDQLWVTDGTNAGTSPRIIQAGGSYPEILAAVGDAVFVSASDGEFGIWKSDGASTIKVKTLGGSPDGSYIQNPAGVGPLLFFSWCSTLGRELWSSDGTDAGTHVTRDINTTPYGSDPGGSFPATYYWVRRGAVGSATIGNTVYFASFDSLWRSDGTPAGTTRVATIPFHGSSVAQLRYLTAWNGAIYFVADTANGKEFWRSDGTAAGTIRLLTTSVFDPSYFSQVFVPWHGRLYFLAERAFYQTDGTVAGTVAVNGTVEMPYWYGNSLTAAGDKLFFVAGISPTLWISDGTYSGTMQLSSVVPSFNATNPDELVAVASSIYFTAVPPGESDGQRSLYRTDGTAAGTVMLAHGVVPTYAGSSIYVPSFLTSVGSEVFFSGYTTGAGWELWHSDGTVTGTGVVADLAAGAASSQPQWLTAAANRVYFAAETAALGIEFWSSDGTHDGTVCLGDVNAGPASSTHGWRTGALDPNEWPIYSGLNGDAFLEADDGTTGVELWHTFGTSVSTRRVADIYPGAPDSNARPMTIIRPPDMGDVALIFSAQDPIYGRELWRTGIDSVPPSVLSSTFDVNPATPAINLIMNEAVDVTSVDMSDLTIRIVNGDGSIGAAVSVLGYSYDAISHVISFSLPTALPDGNYRASVQPGSLSDLWGNALISGCSLDFFILSGDANRDRKVDAKDLGILSTNWQGSGKTFSQGDFNYDGVVDIKDLYILASKWQQTLPAPPPATAPVGVRAPVRTATRIASAVLG